MNVNSEWRFTCVCIMARSTLRELPLSSLVLRHSDVTSTAQNFGWDSKHWGRERERWKYHSWWHTDFLHPTFMNMCNYMANQEEKFITHFQQQWQKAYKHIPHKLKKNPLHTTPTNTYHPLHTETWAFTGLYHSSSAAGKRGAEDSDGNTFRHTLLEKHPVLTGARPTRQYWI